MTRLLQGRSSRRPASRRLAWSLLALAVLGCGDDDSSSTRDGGVGAATWLGAPLSVRDRLVRVDTEHDALYWLDLGGDAEEVTAKRVALPPNPSLVLARAGKSGEALAWTRGLRGVGEAGALVAVEPDGDTRSYTVDGSFTRLEQSEDGRYAVLSVATGASSVAFPPAAVAVVDLDADPKDDEAVHEHPLALDGQPTTRRMISPGLRVDGAHVHLLVAVFARELLLLDLAQPELPALRVTLSGAPSVELQDAPLVFLPEEGRIAMLAAALGDVMVLELTGDDSDRGYGVEVQQHAVGADPVALSTARVEDALQLLVLEDDGQALRILDPDEGTSVELALPSRLDAIASCASCTRALIYAPDRSVAAEVDLAAGSADASARELRLLAPVDDVRVETRHGRALVRHVGDALSLWDLTRSGAGLSLGVRASSPDEAAFGPDGTLWIAPTGEYLLARVDLEARSSEELLLPAPIAGLAFLEDGAEAIVLHPDAEASVTRVPNDTPLSGTSVRLEGLP